MVRVLCCVHHKGHSNNEDSCSKSRWSSVIYLNKSKQPVYKAKLNILITNLLAWVRKTSFGLRDAYSLWRQGRWLSTKMPEFSDFCSSFSWRQIVASLTSFRVCTDLKGQVKRRYKLTSITRFWSPENSFERIFEKFVFAIWAIQILVFTDSEGSEKGRGNVRSIPRVTRKRALTSETIFEFLAIDDSELCSLPVDRWNSSNLTWI